MKTFSTKRIFLLTLATVLLASTAVWAATNEPTTAPSQKNQWKGSYYETDLNALADRVTAKLGLTPDQRSLFVAMHTAEFTLHHLLRDAAKANAATAAAGNAPAESPEIAAARAAASDAKEAFVKSLNATQLPKWREMRDEMLERMKQRTGNSQEQSAPPSE